MKRIILFAILTLAMALSATASTGDVNSDGEVNISDVVAVINVMAGTASYLHADVNADNDVNISDVVNVINIMAGQ